MTVRRRASTNGSRTPETEAAKWNCAIVNGITYTCALPTLTCQDRVEENSLLLKKTALFDNRTEMDLLEKSGFSW